MPPPQQADKSAFQTTPQEREEYAPFREGTCAPPRQADKSAF
jgi:hypothetical protein